MEDTKLTYIEVVGAYYPSTSNQEDIKLMISYWQRMKEIFAHGSGKIEIVVRNKKIVREDFTKSNYPDTDV